MNKRFALTFGLFTFVYLVMAVLFWFVSIPVGNVLVLVYLFVLPPVSIVLGGLLLFMKKRAYAYGCFVSLVSAVVIVVIEMSLGFGASIGNFFS